MNNFGKHPICKDCIINKKFIFSSLNEEELNIISSEKECIYYEKGQIIYQEGNKINGFYCVNKGILKLYKTGVEGRKQIVSFAQEGDIIGFRSVLSKEFACTTAKVIDNAVLCFIPAETLFSLVKMNPDFSMKLMQLTCKELDEANKFLIDIAQKTVRARLAEVLIILNDEFEVDNEKYLQITLTRQELADIVSTSIESAIRILSEFKNDNFIKLDGRKIRIIDISALKRITDVY
ncbi:MAG: Crp/Fnr family transcriptional regulator [Bacteroidales bacterium]|nr:Crp/Fnr family transcriptional regulator [Bacteroidales bacterium]